MDVYRGDSKRLLAEPIATKGRYPTRSKPHMVTEDIAPDKGEENEQCSNGLRGYDRLGAEGTSAQTTPPVPAGSTMGITPF